MTGKILIVGIDGATWSVLRPAVAKGYMPFLAEMIEAGSSGVLESTLPAITPAAWSSFQTGANPGRTGIIDFTYWDAEKQERVITSADLLPETIWEIASEAGRCVGVLNLPMTYPPRRVNGFMVSGLMAPSLESNFTYPASLKQELLEEVPDYHLFSLESVIAESRKENLEEFLKWVAAIVTVRSRAARYLIERYTPDLFMVHFQVNDVVQHVLWPYLDFDHERFDIAKWQAIMHGYYSVLDQRIRVVGETFRGIHKGPVATLLISDHGFQRHRGRFNLWNWMLQRGYLHLELSRCGRTGPEELPLIDWKNTRAFPWGRSNEAFIYLLGDSPRVRRNTAETLQSELIAIIDPVLGTHVIKAVHFKEDIYSGSRMENLPDLVVEPCDGYSVTGMFEPEGHIFRTVIPGEDFHAGRHHPLGIFVAAGAGILPQSDVRVKLIDVAPSILERLGVRVPSEMDGHVVEALVPLTTTITCSESGKERREDCQSRKSRDGEEVSGREQVYSEEEKHLIEERLRDLGYL